MNDIFLSYTSDDREKARQVARALEARGWSVWWDREIPPGKKYDKVIEEALDASNCIVVLWSKASVASGWVRAEADEGVRRRILVPAIVELATIPLGFRRIQAADLTGCRAAAAIRPNACWRYSTLARKSLRVPAGLSWRRAVPT